MLDIPSARELDETDLFACMNKKTEQQAERYNSRDNVRRITREPTVVRHSFASGGATLLRR